MLGAPGRRSVPRQYAKPRVLSPRSSILATWPGSTRLGAWRSSVLHPY
jgi:hypothetical protein